MLGDERDMCIAEYELHSARMITPKLVILTDIDALIVLVVKDVVAVDPLGLMLVTAAIVLAIERFRPGGEEF